MKITRIDIIGINGNDGDHYMPKEAGLKTAEAVSLAGSAAALARLLRISRSAISQWGDDVPTARVWQLKAIRPDWF